ncbi:hypothetical protein E4665_17195 [Sporolactobacillus shoreae]|uniref:Rad50/SbcC-type AAA domain-containing protein n=1 Tax=Sporolactobacillus shoreae TaxID=1465501 RepID=A0A4Z0GGW7_9BACL|nr:hypothetical protein [Sporolactobacillus shoreae]TGA95893.1 hypothetical protein E4665_17195 [Sporolactobacillus shoreae]
MLKINRLRVEINTVNGVYGIDSTFHSGLNFIASSDNTCGKSSILAAIYYCLGFEQIIGGVGGIGEKVLTSVFKSTIDDKGKICMVTESGAYLEITNGIETITIYRAAMASNRDSRLITVYQGAFNSLGDPKTQSEDMYVNVSHSATSEKGFHTYLENFLHLNLPEVRTSDENERKLYLQVIFSSMFIEQKHGWSDIFSGMPILGIKESKKRVIEFLLHLDTFKNEKERGRLKMVKVKIKNEWAQLIEELQQNVQSESCLIENLPLLPRVLSDREYAKIDLTTVEGKTISEEIAHLNKEYNSLRQLKPRVLDNFDALNEELSRSEKDILEFESQLENLDIHLSRENNVIFRLTKDLEIVNSDIRNNNDAARLQKFGSESTGEFSANICPVCNQAIHDTLLLTSNDNLFMNIEDNIRHLKAQKSVLEFSLSSHRQNKEIQQKQRTNIEFRLISLRRLAHTLRSDLFTTTNTDASEAIALKRIEISRRIEILKQLNGLVSSKINKLKNLSKQWNDYLDRLKKLPIKGLSNLDTEKISLLKMKFIENLKLYHYSSLSSFDGIQISEESFLPTIDGFDMKFDSSASDGVRVIWAFTMALLQVSIAKEGNHPNILVFDEPAQQSIVSADMSSFINSVIKLGKDCQVIIAITLNSEELVSIINDLDKRTYNKITVTDKAFKLLEPKNVNGDDNAI